MGQITTITFFKYETFSNKWWAFKMMQFSHQYLQEVKGLTFYKLMGSGKDGGFNPLPDWSVYSLLQVWDSEADANAFWEQSELSNLFKSKTKEIWTLYLKNVMSKGKWSKQTPFSNEHTLDKNNPYLAVITRATIRTKRLISFWRYVPTSQKPIKNAKGLIYTKGIGEAPIVQMATFSLWTDFKALKAFAYDSKEHHKAIEMTRKLDWYKEELFARFQPYKSIGTWNGVQPLTF